MEVTSIPTATGPFVFDSGHGDHGNHGNQDWPARTAERVNAEVNARAFAESINGGNQFAAAQTAVAAVSKDVAILSRDIVISEGRTAVAIQVVNSNVGLLGKDVLLAERNMQIEMAKLAAQQAECCCELKALVLQQNGETRDLIQSNKILELETRLAVLTSARATK